ncbi:MAG: GHMP kinase [Candidatus Omnitrophota bacterium]
MLITRTPLRISFAGGGTDFRGFYKDEDGVVISAAIDKFIYIVLMERYDDDIYVNYSKKEIVKSPAQLNHELVREALSMSKVEKGVEITCLADIPSEQGSGLGSSSAFTVGLLNALFQFSGKQIPAEALAEKACIIEIERCGKHIGKQDQYAAACGGVNVINFNKDESVAVENVGLTERTLEDFDARLMLFYTNIPRKSGAILKEQEDNILSKNKTDILRKMKCQAQEIKQALISKRFDDAGRILNEGWEMKKQLAGPISNPEIEKMYALALDAGALGGKICGAGGGGFLMLYTPLDKRDSVRGALNNYREMPFRFEKQGSAAIFNIKDHPWKWEK